LVRETGTKACGVLCAEGGGVDHAEPGKGEIVKYLVRETGTKVAGVVMLVRETRTKAMKQRHETRPQTKAVNPLLHPKPRFVSHEPESVILSMPQDLNTPKRKSYIEIGEVFFWTATINRWQKLLHSDEYKDVIIQSLEYLSNEGKTDVYAFVIMPNHVFSPGSCLTNRNQ